jgi:hypothetical protein
MAAYKGIAEIEGNYIFQAARMAAHSKNTGITH